MKAQSKINRSEVLKLAHSIYKKNSFLTWSQCQKQAWQVERLRVALRAGTASFTFQKENGEVRAAKGTLNSQLFTYTAKGSDRNESPTTVKFYDLDKNAWRSFRAERIISIAA